MRFFFSFYCVIGILLAISTIPFGYSQYSSEVSNSDAEWSNTVEDVLLEFIEKKILSNHIIQKDTIFTEISGGMEESLPPNFSVRISYDFLDSGSLLHLNSKYQVNFGALARTPENAKLEKISESITVTNNACPQGHRQVSMSYSIMGSKLKNLCYESSAHSVIALIENQNQTGFIHLYIPRILLDSKSMNCEDAQFFVLVNGEEREYEEIKLEKFRVIKVPLQVRDVEVEIGLPLQLESASPTMKQCQKLILQNYRPYEQFKWALNFTYEELGFNYLDREIVRGAPSLLSATDLYGNTLSQFVANKKIYFVFHLPTDYPSSDSVETEIILNLQDTKGDERQILHERIVKKFGKNEPREIKWTFVPKIEGVYDVIFSAEGIPTHEFGLMVIPQTVQTMPPHQQIIEGILPENVYCQSGRNLIFKTTDSSPACVFASTVKELTKRGWGITSPNNVISYTDPCQGKPDPGICRAIFEKYYFNPETSKCEKFNWQGCGGPIPFDTLSECQIQCESTLGSDTTNNLNFNTTLSSNRIIVNNLENTGGGTPPPIQCARNYPIFVSIDTPEQVRIGDTFDIIVSWSWVIFDEDEEDGIDRIVTEIDPDCDVGGIYFQYPEEMFLLTEVSKKRTDIDWRGHQRFTVTEVLEFDNSKIQSKTFQFRLTDQIHFPDDRLGFNVGGFYTQIYLTSTTDTVSQFSMARIETTSSTIAREYRESVPHSQGIILENYTSVPDMDNFAEYIKKYVKVENMTQYLLEQDLSLEYIEEFLEKYPELR